MPGIKVADDNHGVAVAGAVVVVFAVGAVADEFSDGHFQAAFWDWGLKINADGFVVVWLLSVCVRLGWNPT